MSHWFETLSDTGVTVEDAFTAGDKVVGRFTYSAHRTGSFLGVPASGAEITIRSVDIWRFKDHKFAEHWDELNTLDAFQQMGAIPKLGGPR
ncbi:MAG: ester cyclase [Steroidobacteraceae bacterium]